MSIWYSENEEDEYDAEPLEYNEQDILEIAMKVGFEDQDLDMIRKLAAKESSFISNNINPDDFGLPSYGLLQIRENNIVGTGIGNGLIDHGIIDSPDDLADPEINLIAALWVVNREGWGGKDKLKYDDRPYGKWADWGGTIEESFDFFEEALAESEGLSEPDVLPESAVEMDTQSTPVSDDWNNPEVISGEARGGMDENINVVPNRLEDPWDLDLDITSGFDQNVIRFINASGGRVSPIIGRVDPERYRTSMLNWSDEEIGIMGKLRETPFTRGQAVLFQYHDNGEWANQNASSFGIKLHPKMNTLGEQTGRRRKPRFRTHPIARFAELAEGSLHYDD